MYGGLIPKINFFQGKRNYCTSYKFNVKKFNEVKIGDYISSPNDFKFYRIFNKCIREEKYASGAENKIFNSYEYLKGERIDDDKIKDLSMLDDFKTTCRIFMGEAKQVQRENIQEFQNNIISFKPSYLKVDMAQPDKFFHTDKIIVGDIIYKDKKYYRLTSYQESFSQDYGGMEYNVSYYYCKEVDPKNNYEVVPNQKENTLYVGDFNMQLQDNFFTLDY